MEARAADPEIQKAIALAVEAARVADPPWMRGGVELAPPIPAEPISPEALASVNARIAQSQFAVTTFDVSDGKANRVEDPRSIAMTKLKNARKKALDLGATVRSDAFDDWYSRCVVNAAEPKEWTQARQLYESYVRHVQKYGWNRTDKSVAREEMATETGWGKMMAGLSVKKRRAGGQYYPLRLKQGA